METAEEVGKRLGVRVETAAGLAEHDRSNVPHMRSGEFISHVELFFRRPRELVLGNETAEQTAERFEAPVTFRGQNVRFWGWGFPACG